MNTLKVLKALAKCTAKHPDTRYNLTDLRLAPNGEFAACDSHRVWLFKAPVDTVPENMSEDIMIPRDGIKNLPTSKQFFKITRDQDAENIYYFHTDHQDTPFKRNVGRFPDVEKMKPASGPEHPTKKLILAVESLQQMVSLAKAAGESNVTIHVPVPENKKDKAVEQPVKVYINPDLAGMVMPCIE